MSRPAASLLALLVCALPAAAAGEPFDTALYGRLLERHTRVTGDTAGTRVDYRELARSEQWRRLVASVAASEPGALGSRAETLAYWINVYNIFAIDLVVRNHPVESIRDIGSLLRSVWKRDAGTIAGRTYSLDEIEHEILRPLGDPRIHGAIVCASVSCPSLLREPWSASRLDEQFEAAWRAFLADPGKGLALEPETGRVHLSPIFDWFSDDFAGHGGELGFAARYAPEPARAWLARHPDADVRYLDYDWTLNDLARARPDG